jgi:hypothetical protein
MKKSPEADAWGDFKVCLPLELLNTGASLGKGRPNVLQRERASILGKTDAGSFFNSN